MRMKASFATGKALYKFLMEFVESLARYPSVIDFRRQVFPIYALS